MESASPFYPQLTPVRSAIPRAVGILAIIFACIGVAGSALFTAGPLSDIRRLHSEGVGDIVTWLYLWGAISFVLFVVHISGGILACMYRPIGLRLLVGYAVGAIVLVVLDLVVLWAFAPASSWKIRTSVAIPHTAFSLAALAWPIVVLALVTRRRAKLACASSHGP